MKDSTVQSCPISDHPMWERIQKSEALLSLEIELTARCNLQCSHCYINLPQEDTAAMAAELSLEEWKGIIDAAVSLGALWCLITGGEPLLREDFEGLYRHARQRGLLVSVFTNATLIEDRHIRLFRRFPPRDLEVTVYGSRREIYERVTRTPGSHNAFLRGLDRLNKSGIPYTLKAMAIRSNYTDIKEIYSMGRAHSKNAFRLDPMLHLRLDGDPLRNREIRAQRLGPEETAALDQLEQQRFQNLQRQCRKILDNTRSLDPSRLFHCGAGRNSVCIGPGGLLKLCSTLSVAELSYNLKQGSLTDAWRRFVPMVRAMKPPKGENIKGCLQCQWARACFWCPAVAFLETGTWRGPIDEFCAVTRARTKALQMTTTPGLRKSVCQPERQSVS